MKKVISLAWLLCLAVSLFAQLENSPIPADDIVERHTMQENRPLPYPPLRESDILWEKRVWRVIDTREKMNLPFRYPPRPLFAILAEGVEKEEEYEFLKSLNCDVLQGYYFQKPQHHN